jgi:ACR3 family arsenite efflux pump ArsB
MHCTGLIVIIHLKDSAPLYGIGSEPALAAVIGVMLEMFLMLSVVKPGFRTRKYFPRKRKNQIS